MAGLLRGILDPILGTSTDEEDSRAQGYIQQATDAFNGIELPELGPIDLEEYKYDGDVDPRLVGDPRDVEFQGIDPALARAVAQGDTEMRNINVDPRLREQQMSGLEELRRIYEEGGLTAEDRARLSQIQGEVAQADRGRRDAIQQNMAARGMGGSGMELLAALQSNQAATDRAAQSGLNVAAQADSRKLDALLQAGNMAGSLRGQDFGEQSSIAQAQDAINRFNAGQTTQNNQFNSGVLNNTNQFNAGNTLKTDMYNADRDFAADQFNTNTTNTALYANRDARQGVGNANVDTRNKQITMNKIDIPQQGFNNQITKAGGQSNAAGLGAQYWQGRAGKKDDEFGNYVGGGAQIGAAVLSDERKKTNVADVGEDEVKQFLASLSPKKFEYKDEADGQGEFVGTMAQDLLRTEPGSKMVVQGEDGTLGYDSQKMQGMHTAAIKYLADELAKLKGGKNG